VLFLPLRNIEFLSIKRTLAIMAIGLLVFSVYIYFSVDATALLSFLSGVNEIQFIVFYSLALGLVVLSVFFWGMAWRSILQKLSVTISWRKMFLIYWAGYFVDLAVPLERVAGDIVRIYLLKKQTKAYYATLISSTIVDRLIAYFAVIAGLIFATIVLVFYNAPTFVLVFFFIIFAFSLVYFIVLLYLAFSQQAAENIARFYIRTRRFFLRNKRESKNLEAKTMASLGNFYNGFAPFRHDLGAFKKPFLYHALAYFIRIFVYFLIFYSLGLVNLPIAFYVTVYFLGSAVQDAVGSFSVGSLDILLVALFGVFGIEAGAGSIGALLVRSADFWFPLAVALALIQFMGIRNIVMRAPKKMLSKQKRGGKRA